MSHLPLQLPLRGQSLIEASAGTGKTFTLALLYVRLILNHGGGAAFGEALLPNNILVVTFTKAATQELRDRIRARLVEAAAYLRGEITDVDDVLHDLCAEFQAQDIRAGAAKRLALAAESMDEAAISTIHAWCYRLLSEFALHYGGAFEQQILESETELLQQASEDFWRQQVLTMPRSALTYMMRRFDSPASLLKEVARLLPHVKLLPANVTCLASHIDAMEAQKKAAINDLKAPLSGHVDELRQFFQLARQEKRFAAGKLRANHEAGAFKAIDDYLASDAITLKANASLEKLAFMDTSIWSDADSLPHDLAGAKALATVLSFDGHLPSADEGVLFFATQWIHHQLTSSKQQQGLLSNDDLLIRLQQALHGPGGTGLAKAIRQRFPMAMVDEFQDTDPVQYDIFSRVYDLPSGCPEAGFIMIGDPKQAIYGFRGGDIYTYLQARQHARQSRFTLDANYRSDKDLIESVNGLFEYGEQFAGGAFRFHQVGDNGLPFEGVKAGRTGAYQLMVEGQPQLAQSAWVMPATEDGKAIKSSAYLAEMGAATANEIARLLNLADAEKALLIKDGKQTLLQPKHLAVLVADKTEAAAVRAALAQRYIASVYLSDASSVYSTEVAKALLHCLRAIADPDDDRLLMMALATPLMGSDLLQLDALQCDELAWEQQVERFHHYHGLWQQQGVLPVVYQLIFDSDSAARLLSRQGGERDLTDLLHLAELLQQAAVNIDGEHALVRYFELLLDNPDQQDAAQQQRLESDSNLVQVVTVHKSKGLEYPVVFLPYLSRSKLVDANKGPHIYRHPVQGKQVCLRADDKALLSVQEDRRAEEIRKLYVALTRAACCQYVGVGEIENSFDSGFGALLMQEQDVGTLSQRLQSVSTHLPIVPLPEEHEYTGTGLASDEVTEARKVDRLFIQPWYMASYSALRFSADEETTQVANDSYAESATDAILLEEQQQDHRLLLPAVSEAFSIHTLPKGALYGTMLHEIMEDCAAHGFAEVLSNPPLRQQLLLARMEPLQVTDWLQAVDSWLCDFLVMPWDLSAIGQPEPMQLQHLQAHQLAVEMEFIIASKQVDVPALDALVCQYSRPEVPRPVAQAQQLQGMLKGYIDLIMEYQGQYYIVDWKSNYLGEDACAYDSVALQQALLHKRYDMQYLLYTLALHRLLQARLADYDYDKHVGGAVYVFMRGIENSETQGLIMEKPSRALIEAMDSLFQGVMA